MKLLSILIAFLNITFIIIDVSVSYGQTEVKGNITENTTWAKINSPYIVTGTVQVFPGVALTIEPGVEIKINENILIHIKGILASIGAINDSIIFTASQNSWEGLKFESPDTAFLKYCRIEKANNAIYIDGEIYNTYINIDSSNIINNSNYGIYAKGANGGFMVENSRVSFNKIGIYLLTFASVVSDK